MKNTVFLFQLLLSAYPGFSQIASDTVYTNYTQTVYLVFPKEVDFFDVNPKDLYSYTPDGKTVFLKSKLENAKQGSYVAKCGDDYYQGVVMYNAPELKRIFYDFRNVTHEVTTTTTVKTIVHKDKELEPIDTTMIIIRENLGQFKVEGNKYKTIGIIENNIYLGVTNLKHDKFATYLKIKVVNSSNVSYALDFFAFEVMEAKTITRNEVKPIIENSPRVVPSKKDEYIFIVLPLIAIPENTELKIILREKNGLRTVTLYVPAKPILSASNF